MEIGLVLGKFYPLHKGHEKLIAFGSKNCDKLYVLICAEKKEKITGKTRLKWIRSTYKNNDKIIPILYNYSEKELPNTSKSSKKVSKIWAKVIAQNLPKIDVVFSSEKYGDYLANYLKCKHKPFDIARKKISIAASTIRQHPIKNWDYIADKAKPIFVKKIIIGGTESTGKSTLVEKLATHYRTVFVPEMARDIIANSTNFQFEDLYTVAKVHANEILKKNKLANKLLFIDTDISITKSYANFFFDKKLKVSKKIKKANSADIYLFLDKDAPYIQDGTRLGIEERNKLQKSHLKQLSKQKKLIIIEGNWEERFEKAKKEIDKLLENW